MYSYSSIDCHWSVMVNVFLICVNSNSATMGILLSKSMDANLKKQQEFMLHNARLQVSRARVRHVKTTLTYMHTCSKVHCAVTVASRLGLDQLWFRFYLITLVLYSLYTLW